MSAHLGPVIKLVVGVLLFAGLPLLGWGVMDISGFIRNPVRLAYIGVAVLLQVLIVIRMPEIGRKPDKGKKTVQCQRMAVLMLQVISLAIVIGAPYSDRSRELPRLARGMPSDTSALLCLHWGWPR